MLGGRPAGGDQPHPQGDERASQRLLAPQQALGVEQPQQPVAVGGQAPERERRVDVGHLHLEAAAGRVPVDPALDAHLGAVGHADAAARLLQPAVHPPAGGVEHHDRQAGHRRAGGVGARRRLDQVEPHHAGAPPVEVADLAPHPQFVGERAPQRQADRLAQVGDRPGRFVVVPEGRRVGWRPRRRRLAADLAHREEGSDLASNPREPRRPGDGDRAGCPRDRHAPRRVGAHHRRLPDHRRRPRPHRDREPVVGARPARRPRRAQRRPRRAGRHRGDPHPPRPRGRGGRRGPGLPRGHGVRPPAGRPPPGRPDQAREQRGDGLRRPARLALRAAHADRGRARPRAGGRRAGGGVGQRHPHAHRRRLARPRQAPPGPARLRLRAAVRGRRRGRATARRRHPAAGHAPARLRPRPGPHQPAQVRRPVAGGHRARPTTAWCPTRPRSSTRRRRR